MRPHSFLLSDLEGLGTTEERGRLMSEYREEYEGCEMHDADRERRVEAGKSIVVVFCDVKGLVFY